MTYLLLTSSLVEGLAPFGRQIFAPATHERRQNHCSACKLISCDAVEADTKMYIKNPFSLIVTTNKYMAILLTINSQCD